MEKYLDKNLHGRGYFRKTKQWGLACGIALAGAIVFGSQSASADEVTAQPSVKEAESAVVANKVDDNMIIVLQNKQLLKRTQKLKQL